MSHKLRREKDEGCNLEELYDVPDYQEDEGPVAEKTFQHAQKVLKETLFKMFLDERLFLMFGNI